MSLSLYVHDFLVSDAYDGGRIPRVHFAGILGVSMSSLAEYMHRLGFVVTGSDIGVGATRERLETLGIEISVGNSDTLVHDCDLLVASLAIGDSSPEVVTARELGIRVITRQRLLGAIMRGYRERIGVSGTHGKSTITAMLHHALTSLGKSPTTFSGAELMDGRAFSIGSEDYFVYEACEYKRAFLDFYPTTAIISSLELDHTDCYEGEAELVEAFRKSVEGATRVILNVDYPLARELLDIKRRVITYGENDFADYRLEIKQGGAFTLNYKGCSEDFKLSVLGRHNAYNATAAIITLLEYGMCITDIKRAISTFKGVPRRLEYLGRLRGAPLYYDYAHHPTEIRASIETLKQEHGGVFVVFRPHTYTRTRDLWNGFVAALSLADRVVVTDVFAAREEAIKGIDAGALASSVGGSCEYVEYTRLASYLNRLDTPLPIVIMGAGDYTELLQELRLDI